MDVVAKVANSPITLTLSYYLIVLSSAYPLVVAFVRDATSLLTLPVYSSLPPSNALPLPSTHRRMPSRT